VPKPKKLVPVLPLEVQSGVKKKVQDKIDQVNYNERVDDLKLGK